MQFAANKFRMKRAICIGNFEPKKNHARRFVLANNTETHLDRRQASTDGGGGLSTALAEDVETASRGK